MGEFAKKYAALGARVIGGCCGNTPEHIAAISKALK
jgi:homocysteine S-methyltransferase